MEDIKTTPVITRIKESRKRAHISQVKLASLVGVQPNTVWRWENGKASPMESIKEIARALNTSIAYLTEETDDPSRCAAVLGGDNPLDTGNLPYHDVFQAAITAARSVAAIAVECNNAIAWANDMTSGERFAIIQILKNTLNALEAAEVTQSEESAST